MATTLAFKDIIDLPEWRPIANAITTNAAGMYTAFDQRGTEDRIPLIYYLTSAATLSAYNVKNDEWLALASPALTGTFGAGAGAILHPSQGPRGTITTGATTSTIVLSTALPAAVGSNQLANRGDGTRGFRIKIVGSSAGGSGKTEERLIIGNTAGTTPTIRVDTPFSFTPASGDTYEILSGRVFLLSAGTLAAGMWKYYDIATNSYSGNLATTNLPATVGTDSTLCALSERYNPYNRLAGDGFLVGASTYNGGIYNCLLATGSSGTTLTGQASSGDAAVLANEYRNFQIRIVEDTAIPTAVGQRRNITSHTAGVSPVYTVPAWTVTPSTTCKYVIENNDDRIILWSSASTSSFCYNIAANTWDTTTFAARGSAVGAGCKAEQAYGIVPDADKNARNSFIYSIRGGASSAIDVFDIAGAATGAWTNAINYGNLATTFTTGTSAAYDPNTNQGRYIYINQSGTQRNLRFDCLNRVLESWAFLRYAQGAVTVGEKSAMTFFYDGSTSLGFWMQLKHTGTEFFQIANQR